ncbi:MAG: RNA polymerase sigma-70 factor [Bacteroidia bacterium]|nr:RNA polymerase sigma-70 factor [Bacteroidia bacterium]
MKPDSTPKTIGYLFSTFQKGNEEAFETLFRRYYPIFCAYAQRFVAIEDAEEIVQDIMLWLYNNKEMFVIESSLGSYIFKMIYNRSLNKISQKEVKKRADTYYYESRLDMLYDLDVYQIEELTKKIHQAIDALPEKYKEAFVMHRFKEMSYKEIAAQLEVSTKTIDYRIQQALKVLRQDLKEYLPLLFILGGMNS